MAQQQKIDIALPRPNRPRKPIVLPPPPIKNDNHIININIDGSGGGGGNSAADVVVLSSIQALNDQLAEISQTITNIQAAQESLSEGQKNEVLEIIHDNVTDTLDLSALNESITDLNDDF